MHVVLKAMGHFQALRSADFVGIVDKQAYGEAVEMILGACLGLIILWAGTISGFGADLVLSVLQSNELAPQAHNFRPIGQLMSEGKNREALYRLRRLGAKSEESRLLQARIHENLGEADEARRIYKKLLRRPGSVSHLAVETLLARLA